MKLVAKYIQSDQSHVEEDIEDLENVMDQNKAIMKILKILLDSFKAETIEKVKKSHPNDFNEVLAEYRNKEIKKIEYRNMVSEDMINQLKKWNLPGMQLKLEKHLDDVEKTLKNNEKKIQQLKNFEKKQKH